MLVRACDRQYNNSDYFVPFGNWLRRNHYYEYDEMYTEWEQKQPWFTGIIEEDKFV